MSFKFKQLGSLENNNFDIFKQFKSIINLINIKIKELNQIIRVTSKSWQPLTQVGVLRGIHLPLRHHWLFSFVFFGMKPTAHLTRQNAVPWRSLQANFALSGSDSSPHGFWSAVKKSHSEEPICWIQAFFSFQMSLDLWFIFIRLSSSSQNSVP